MLPMANMCSKNDFNLSSFGTKSKRFEILKSLSFRSSVNSLYVFENLNACNLCKNPGTPLISKTKRSGFPS